MSVSGLPGVDDTRSYHPQIPTCKMPPAQKADTPQTEIITVITSLAGSSPRSLAASFAGTYIQSALVPGHIAHPALFLPEVR